MSAVGNVLDPDGVDSPRGTRTRRLAIIFFVAVLATLFSWFSSFGLDYLSAPTSARREKSVQDELDGKNPPFTFNVRSEDSDGSIFPGAIVFDHVLNSEDVEILKKTNLDADNSERKIMSVVHANNGTFLSAESSHHGYSSPFFLDFFSDRDSSLSIVAMKAVDVHCSPAKAAAVLVIRPRGGGAVPGIMFDLPRGNLPVSVAPDKNYGKPFFDHQKIDLGNGATPGALRVQSVAERSDCTWKIQVTHSDSSGLHTSILLDHKKPFKTLGIPLRSQQEFILDDAEHFEDCNRNAKLRADCDYIW
ncbi:hypothetical protein ACIQCJ_03415 [Streptomyces sp. NPDC093221]|uniref:hypothetical protein n=1 Tax=Streptomyces sp. NPDC093221 TaxID=3366032 RepID=UPI0037F4D8CA